MSLLVRMCKYQDISPWLQNCVRPGAVDEKGKPTNVRPARMSSGVILIYVMCVYVEPDVSY